jgi:serine/threonine kinase 16
MGCSFSGLNAIYGAAGGTGEVWVNDNRFRILRQIGGTDVSSTVYLVKENLPDGAIGLAKKKSIDPSHISGTIGYLYFESRAFCPTSILFIYFGVC